MACYAWSHQNSEYMHGPHVSLCDWGCIDLHGSHPSGVHLLSVVPPFPTWFVVWLLNSTRELFFSLHATGDEYEGLQKAWAFSCSWVVNFPKLFCSAASAAWLSFVVRNLSQQKCLGFIRFKHVNFGFDMFLLGDSSMSQTYLHLFYKHRVDQHKLNLTDI